MYDTEHDMHLGVAKLPRLQTLRQHRRLGFQHPCGSMRWLAAGLSPHNSPHDDPVAVHVDSYDMPYDLMIYNH